MNREHVLLAASLGCLYILPHFMESTVLVGVGFGIVLVGAARPTFVRRQLVKYASYLAVSLGTYYILFQENPWEFLFGWLPESIEVYTGIPVTPCSVIMSFAGWLLLPGKTHRRKYLLATLLVQVPLAVSMTESFSAVLSAFQWLAKILRYTDEHLAASQAWQFLWMLNYYFPIYVWSRARRGAA